MNASRICSYNGRGALGKGEKAFERSPVDFVKDGRSQRPWLRKACVKCSLRGVCRQDDVSAGLKSHRTLGLGEKSEEESL